MRLLVVEDDPVLREGLQDLLRGDGHDVRAAADGEAAAALGAAERFDLVVLDLGLPTLDGLEVCRRLKTARPDTLVLMLTARGSEEEKVKGLSSGADDYLTKPFGARELLARVAALGRRAGPVSDVLEADGASIDLGRLLLRRGESERTLTAREGAILRFLHRHRGRAVTRRELLVHVWGVRGDLETRTVDTTIANLRKKVEADPRAPRLVVSVPRIGYAWGPDLGP